MILKNQNIAPQPYAAQPIPIVHIGLIGLGDRGQKTLKRYMIQEGVEVIALCDLSDENINKGEAILQAYHKNSADHFSDAEGWKHLCERDDIDLVIICTDWLKHTPMAVYAMKQGKHVAVEVPAATTVEDCWQLIETAEATHRHCIMLENCCYDTFALCTLEMSRQGMFGDIMHVEGAYIHDLRKRCFIPQEGEKSTWESRFYQKHTGNPYPTHGIGPACQLLGINHSDKMVRIVSMSSAQKGLTEYVTQKFGADSDIARTDYKLGDMSTSIIMTEQGKTIMLQHCVNVPRPYSRIQSLTGTKGYACKYPTPTIAFDGEKLQVVTDEALDELLKKYEPSWMKQYDADGERLGVTNMMNYRMDRRLIEALQNGEPLDMSVYDAAEWSCLVELSEKSVVGGNIPIDIPDFTKARK